MNVTAIYRRDEAGAWIVELAEEPRCHTFGSTIAKARTMLADVMTLWFDEKPTVTERFEIDPFLDEHLRSALEARAEAEVVTRNAMAATRETAKLLIDKGGLSLRDAGTLLGISHQRVHQLLDS